MRKILTGCLSFLLLLAMPVTIFAETSDGRATPLEELTDPLIGTPYLWSGSTEKGFDCSGFTRFVFEKIGIELPRTSSSQATQGEKVAKEDLRMGDLVFFNTNGVSISHVGIYLADGQFIHASTNHGVTKSKLSEDYYATRYVTARRILDEETYQKWTQPADSHAAAQDEEGTSGQETAETAEVESGNAEETDPAPENAESAGRPEHPKNLRRTPP